MEIKKINIKSGKITLKNNINFDSIISRNNNVKITYTNGQRAFRTNIVGEQQCFSMNEIGNAIWDIIENPIDINGLIEEILKRFNVKRHICEPEVIEFIKLIKRYNIIKINI